MACFTIKTMCENAKSTLQKWFREYSVDEDSPLHKYDLSGIMDEWSGELRQALANIPVFHLQWYDIWLVDTSDGEMLSIEFRIDEDHPMYAFYPKRTAFYCNLGKLVYEKCTVPRELPFFEDEERGVCADLLYDESSSGANATFDDVIRWIESRIHDHYEKIRIIDAYMADKTPDENEAFIGALSGLLTIEDTQLKLDSVMDANWRINFINAWENA